ncbi:unnamed protein product [Protopolystoma xenopodis]|uniref:Uncharacterized protein n=1 Tax=Protopolystoma xenopodis TaxID=117903 RepID=A0A3S5CFR0_9PLAT|nr:unnamed protein product [Protopolystoma xenopodis]
MSWSCWPKDVYQLSNLKLIDASGIRRYAKSIPLLSRILEGSVCLRFFPSRIFGSIGNGCSRTCVTVVKMSHPFTSRASAGRPDNQNRVVQAVICTYPPDIPLTPTNHRQIRLVCFPCDTPT